MRKFVNELVHVYYIPLPFDIRNRNEINACSGKDLTI